MPPTLVHTSWRGLEELRPAVLRFLSRRCRDEHEAEDLAQETLLRAARYRKGGGERGRLAAWLVQIAANVFHDHARREGRGPRTGGDDEWLSLVEDPRPWSGPGEPEGVLVLAEQPVAADEAVRYLQAALMRLIERDRAVLCAYYGGTENTREVAAEFDIPPDLVKVRLFRARKRLGRLILQEMRAGRSRHLALTA